MSNSQPDLTQQQELPCDFLAFLQSRLGIEAAAAADVLGEWLVSYEPGPVARANAKEPVRVRPRRSAPRSPASYVEADAA
ncbi:MAG TPA: hypothetical protein VJN18_12705 [Polyangiaceae bacterium]|nr:hypothetical protein [Polyangiaceae bacterium]